MYKKYAKEVAILLGGDEFTSEAEMDEMVEFETKLAKVRAFVVSFNRHSLGCVTSQQRQFGHLAGF